MADTQIQNADPGLIPDPDHEEFKVHIIRDKLIDESRGGRGVPIKVYVPDDNDTAPLPVVIWSHGLGGSRDGAGFIARYIASNGYIVINIQHRGTDTSLWEGKPGHPWDNIRSAKIPRKATLQRLQDVPFVLDSLEEWSEEQPQVAGRLDFDRIGMSGHSFGALTTQVMAVKDDRFKAAISYSPSTTYNGDEDPKALYGDIDIPMLFITGTDDSSPVKGWDYTYRLRIVDNAGENLSGNDKPPKYGLILEDADHMVFAGSRGKLGENPKRPVHEAALKQISLIFWNAYLKDDAKYKDLMHNDQIKSFLAENDIFRAY